MSRFFRILKKAGTEWSKQNALEWGAALAYYTAFSIAPLFIIALSIVGLFDKGNSLNDIHDQMANLVGRNAADALTGAMQSVRASEHGRMANIISVVVLLIGASSVFGQLQVTLNRIWGVEPQPGHFWKDLFKQRLISFAMILGISFLMLVLLIVSAILAVMAGYFEYLLPGGAVMWQVLDAGVSFAIIVLLFGAIFKIVPDVQIEWADVWMGAIVTAALFVAGKAVIGFYLGRSGLGSAYGAAGSILIMLAWVYYSSQILFLGAEFTKLYAEERRGPARPIEGVRRAA